MQVALGHEEEEICLDVEDSTIHDAPMELVQLSRGYASPFVHQMRAGCMRKAARKPAHMLIQEGTDVGALRVSVGGWEGWVWQGLKVESFQFPFTRHEA